MESTNLLRVCFLLTVAHLFAGCGKEEDDDHSNSRTIEYFAISGHLTHWSDFCFSGRFPQDEATDSKKRLSEKTYNRDGTIIEEIDCASSGAAVTQTNKKAALESGNILGALKVTDYAELTVDAKGLFAGASRWDSSDKTGTPDTLTVTRGSNDYLASVTETESRSSSTTTTVWVFDTNEVLIKETRTRVSTDGGTTDETQTIYTPATGQKFLETQYEESENGVVVEKGVTEAGGDFVVTQLIASNWLETRRSTPFADNRVILSSVSLTSTSYDEAGIVESKSSSASTLDANRLTTTSETRNAKDQVIRSEKNISDAGSPVTFKTRSRTIELIGVQNISEETTNMSKAGTTTQTILSDLDDEMRATAQTMTVTFDALPTEIENYSSSYTCLNDLLCLSHLDNPTGAAYSVTVKALHTYSDYDSLLSEVTEFTGADRSRVGLNDEFKVVTEYAP